MNCWMYFTSVTSHVLQTSGGTDTRAVAFHFLFCLEFTEIRTVEASQLEPYLEQLGHCHLSSSAPSAGRLNPPLGQKGANFSHFLLMIAVWRSLWLWRRNVSSHICEKGLRTPVALMLNYVSFARGTAEAQQWWTVGDVAQMSISAHISVL